MHPNEGGKGGLPPEWDVNLFILRAGGRGVYADAAAQGLIPASASALRSAAERRDSREQPISQERAIVVTCCSLCMLLG